MINNINEVFHRIKVKLYPNYLAAVLGLYLARTNNEASLTIEQICVALKNRGGFTGNYDDLVEHIHQFLDEAVYQLCDGFEVNMGYFSIHPNVGETFDKVNEAHDVQKHPVTFHFRARAPLRVLAERIVVEIEGLADVTGYIDEFVDVSTESMNDALTPGGQFSIVGHKIKIAGDKPEIGAYFVSVSDSSQRIKVSGHLAENTANKLIGIVPVLNAGSWKLEIVTQYSSGNTFLKEPRVLELTHELTVDSDKE
jgi:hypothetical protein